MHGMNSQRKGLLECCNEPMADTRRGMIGNAALLTFMTARVTSDALYRNDNPLYYWAWVVVLAPQAILCWLTISRPFERVKGYLLFSTLAWLVPAGVLTALARAHEHESHYPFWMNCIFFGVGGVVLSVVAIRRWRRGVEPPRPNPEP